MIHAILQQIKTFGGIFEKTDVRRRFSAKKRHTKWGWFFLVCGIGGIAGGGVVLLPLGLYLLRGPVGNSATLEKNKSPEVVQETCELALAKLEASVGGATLVAYRNLEVTVEKYFKENSEANLSELLLSIKFDRSRLESKFIGQVETIFNGRIEVFQGWIINGQSAYDIDVSTRGEVFVDGSVQLDAENEQRDFRTAELQFVSNNWSLSSGINPELANDARRLISQLSIITDALKPTSVTTSDISSLVQSILTNTGQSSAERISQLNDLRYQQLLSDDEFEAAKIKVLGI
jgi:hypothetical protein